MLFLPSFIVLVRIYKFDEWKNGRMRHTWILHFLTKLTKEKRVHMPVNFYFFFCKS